MHAPHHRQHMALLVSKSMRQAAAQRVSACCRETKNNVGVLQQQLQRAENRVHQLAADNARLREQLGMPPGDTLAQLQRAVSLKGSSMLPPTHLSACS